jgi:hypothetical protein
MAYVVPTTFTAGSVLAAAQLNVIGADLVDHESRIVTATSNDTKLLAAVPARSTQTSTAQTTSTSFSDSGLTVSITPTATTSLVEVCFTIYLGCSVTATASLNLLRGATNIAQGATCTSGNVVTSSQLSLMSLVFIDSPATTSATTYKVQWKTSTGTLYMNRRGDANDVNPISYLQVREIAQ